MAISSALCTSFKQQLLNAEHDLDTDVFKMALYTSSANLDATTTVYTTTEEVVGTGYTAGGETMTGATISVSGTTAFVDFDDVTWSDATFTANGALIYNTTNANKAVAVIAFGGDQTVSSGTFTVTMPVADASNAIIRLA